jgi:menaquinol-cytochrome c reductase iron-sulfur subunit
MAAAEHPETETSVTRRRFYITAIYGLWSVVASALAIPAALYLLLPPRLRRAPQWVEAGDVSKIEPNAPLEMVFRENRIDGWKILSDKTSAWVVELPGNKIVAFGPQCTHLGCAYHWDETRDQFLCPCHSSVFAIDGRVISGPAPRPLDRYETKVENGKLLLGPLHESEEKT